MQSSFVFSFLFCFVLSFGSCVLFFMLFVQFQKDAVPPFGKPLSRLSVAGRHINSNKNCSS